MGSWRHSKRKSATGREVCSWGQGFGPGPFCFCLVYLELDLDELNLEARQLELVNRWARSRRYGWELDQVAPGARAQELKSSTVGSWAKSHQLKSSLVGGWAKSHRELQPKLFCPILLSRLTPPKSQC